MRRVITEESPVSTLPLISIAKQFNKKVGVERPSSSRVNCTIRALGWKKISNMPSESMMKLKPRVMIYP